MIRIFVVTVCTAAASLFAATVVLGSLAYEWRRLERQARATAESRRVERDHARAELRRLRVHAALAPADDHAWPDAGTALLDLGLDADARSLYIQLGEHD